MRETVEEKVAWRRHGRREQFVGLLRAGDEGIRLVGRDPASGVQVGLSIPPDEVERVRVSSTDDELLAGEPCVVLELAGSRAISVRELGARPLRVHLLARSLDALAQASPTLVRGG
jgi:hypothetical protein